MFSQEQCRRIVASIEGTPFVDELDFSGCGTYEYGARCGRPVVERLVPIYGDARPAFGVCQHHLDRWRREHLLA